MADAPPSTTRRRLGLRGRLIASFATGALVLSVSMGAIAYLTTRHFLLTERKSAALHQAYANAALLRDALAAQVPQVSAELSSLDSGPRSTSLLDHHGTWFSTSLAVGRSTLPSSLRTEVAHNHVVVQTAQSQGSPFLFVGVPLPSVDATYFLAYDLSDVKNTLRVMLAALAAAAGVTTLLGAVLGSAASRRAVRPLTEVSDAAVAIAAGELDTRLPVDPADPDLRGLTSSFNAMVDQLQDRLNRDARFTSDVSHELRSPLTTLAASLDVLEAHRDELDPRGRQALDLMAGDVRRFQRLVADLLEIARSDANAKDLLLDEVGAAELIRQTVAAAGQMRPLSPSLEIHIDPSAENVRLLVDKRRFERILGNLLENAENHGGGATGVFVSSPPGEEVLEISVTDQGPGIPAADRDRIFDRFYRGQVSGRRGSGEGSGLGLAIVLEHVLRHHGTVRVTDGPGGRGTVVTVRLPFDPERPTP